MSRFVLVLLLACSVSGCAATSAGSPSVPSETERNRTIVRDFARLSYHVRDVIQLVPEKSANPHPMF